MKNLFFSIFLVFSFINVNAQADTTSQFQKVTGFSHPESVVMDSRNKVIYVSNIGEKEEGDGFISRVSLDGEVLDQKWVTGLNDPKGLLLINNVLWVTDNTDLVYININEGKIEERIPVEDASFLNDITVGVNGVIYISDTGKSSIYIREPSGKISEWLKTEELEFPNGLLAVGKNLYVAAWGGEGPGNVLRIEIDSKTIEKITKRGIGNLDGIQQINDEQFYISDWASGKIYMVDLKGEVTEVLTSEKSAGDILFNTQANQLVIPMNHQNEVWWYNLE